MGFAATNKFVYNILNDFDTEKVGGLTFESFLKLATGRLGEEHTQEEVSEVFRSFDLNKKVNKVLFREK